MSETKKDTLCITDAKDNNEKEKKIMTGLQFGAAIIGGAIIAIVAAELIRRSRSMNTDNAADILKACFGEPMHTGTFSMREAVQWLKAHHKDGSKGVIFKADSKALEAYSKLHLHGDPGNYLIMAMLDEAGSALGDSVLIKYDMLDSVMEDALGADGMLVVED